MRIAMALLAVSLAFGSAGCKKREKAVSDNTMMGSGSADTTGSAGSGSAGSAAMGSGSAGSGDTAGSAADPHAGHDTKMPRRGGNCPSIVATSTTKAELNKGGQIVLTITSDDKDAIAAIQKRTTELLKEKTDGGTPGTGHDQKGTHGGGMGLCPVHIDEGGTATSKTEAKGVVITITPKGKAEILKGEIDSRILKAAEYLKANVKEGDKGTTGGVGGGKGEHGSNHSGDGDSKGMERTGAGKGDGKGGGKGTGGGGGAGTGGGGSGSATK